MSSCCLFDGISELLGRPTGAKTSCCGCILLLPKKPGGKGAAACLCGGVDVDTFLRVARGGSEPEDDVDAVRGRRAGVD